MNRIIPALAVLVLALAGCATHAVTLRPAADTQAASAAPRHAGRPDHAGCRQIRRTVDGIGADIKSTPARLVQAADFVTDLSAAQQAFWADAHVQGISRDLSRAELRLADTSNALYIDVYGGHPSRTAIRAGPGAVRRDLASIARDCA